MSDAATLLSPALCCDRCGYGYQVRRVALLVDGRVVVEARLCSGCLSASVMSTQPTTVPAA